jgi:phospholipid/cholesterol/gamma-HCH transport system substrate-binding protein
MNRTTITPEPSPGVDGGGRQKQQPNFQRINELTGTLVLVVIAVLIAVGVWTGRSQRWFKSNVMLRILLPADGAAGIRQGSEVYFLGTLVGSVSDVIVDTTGRMEARARIRHDFFLFVRTDSSAVIKRKFGVAGDSFFEITRGEGKPLPEKNASIVCNEQLQSALESAIDEIRSETLLVLKKTSAGLDTWTLLGADLRETRQHLDELTGRLGNITAGVEQGKGTVGELLTDTGLADEAQKLLVRANQTMSELQVVATNLNAAVRNVQTGTERLPEITSAVADEARDLPGLVQQTQISMRELERLIEGMQRHWLLRKYMNKTNPASARTLPETGAPGRKPSNRLSSPAASAN